MAGLIRFRWIALVALVLGTFPLLHWGYLRNQNLFYFVAVLALLAVFNVLSLGIFPSDPSRSSNSILIQLWVDLLAAVGLLFVSGTAANPFTSILCIHAFMGGMLLAGWRTYVFGFSVLVLLGFLQFETYRAFSHNNLGTFEELMLSLLSQWVLVAGSWFVSHYFSALLQKKERKIRLLQDRQHQADRLKALGALTAGFSHEMATPMNALQLRMERGLRKLDARDPQALEELRKAETALRECVDIFKRMATIFSRSESPVLQKVELNTLVPELLKVWEKENPDIKIEKHLMSQSLPTSLSLLSFSQSLFDLLDNAAEVTKPSECIYCRLYSENEKIVLEIIDKGPGLSAEILSRLGEPFVTSKEHGNGLGIYSAGMMAQSAGGEFRIRNNTSGGGAIAQIRLPLEEERP